MQAVVVALEGNKALIKGGGNNYSEDNFSSKSLRNYKRYLEDLELHFLILV